MACVNCGTLNDSLGVTILKLNFTVEELDRVDFGFIS